MSPSTPARLPTPSVSQVVLVMRKDPGQDSIKIWGHFLALGIPRALSAIGLDFLEGLFDGSSYPDPSFTIESGPDAGPVVAAWGSESLSGYPSHEAMLVGLAPAWLSAFKRVFEPYREQVLARGRFAGTPYLARELTLSAPADRGGRDNRALGAAGSRGSLLLRGLPGSGLPGVSLASSTPAARSGLILTRPAHGRWPNRQEAQSARLPVGITGAGLRDAAALMETYGRDSGIAASFAQASPATLALFDALAGIFV
jgi:hypothetical protein